MPAASQASLDVDQLLASLSVSVSRHSKAAKWINVCMGHQEKPRRITWFEPCEASALDLMVRASCQVPSDRQYLLLDATTMAAVAVSSSLPSGSDFELALLPPPSGGLTDRAGAVVVVDPVSTGVVLAYQLHACGLHVISVWSDVVPDELKAHVDPRYGIEFSARLQHEAGELEATVAAVRALGMDIREVMVGCETGVILADELSDAMGVRSNGTLKSGLRRNKFRQTEAVRSAGLNACGQMLADSREDVEKFLREIGAVLKAAGRAESDAGGFKAVVKPVEGAGSDGVFICNSHDEVRRAYASLEGTKNVLGLTNYSVLLQEFLRGDEYVVDTVSRSGVHKCVAIWKYDKRMYNGSPARHTPRRSSPGESLVVYYGMRLMPLDAEPFLAEMVRYVFGVLEALGIRNGAIHSEVKMEERGPVLIEANCRLHGGEGTWAPMAVACLGYSAVSAMVDAYLDPVAFAALPVAPVRFRAHAKEAKVRSAVSGTLSAIDVEALKAIRSLKSYQSEILAAKVGGRIERTVDLLTSYGNVNLVHESLTQLEADYTTFNEILDKGLFTVRPEGGIQRAHTTVN